MADDDVIEDLQGVSTMTLTSAARAAEVLLRASQDRALREAAEQRREVEEARRRYEARASVAEEFYRTAGDPEFARTQTQDVVANTWRGAQEWKDLEPARFGPHADRITENIRAEYGIDLDAAADRLGDRDLAAELAEMRVQRTRGVDEDQDLEPERGADPGVTSSLEYDTDHARLARTEQLEQSDLEPEVKNALRVADHLNGRDPADAAASSDRVNSPERARSTKRSRVASSERQR